MTILDYVCFEFGAVCTDNAGFAHMGTPKFSSLRHSNDHRIHACPGYLFASEHTAQDSFSYDSSNNSAETGRQAQRDRQCRRGCPQNKLEGNMEQIRYSQQKERFLSTDVDGFDALVELALDLRSSWNHATDQVWRQLDSELWDMTQNPWVVLQTVSREKMQNVLAVPDFRKIVDDLVQTRRDEVVAPAWFQQTYPHSPLSCVAYFSMEFMLLSRKKVSEH